MNVAIAALILTIATEVGIPPNFALAIALEENVTLNPTAVTTRRSDGTRDLGVMQLNSERFGHIDWKDPVTNIRAGCIRIKTLYDHDLNWWQVAIAYDCGYGQLKSKNGPPYRSIMYADRVFAQWEKLDDERTTQVLDRYFEAQRKVRR